MNATAEHAAPEVAAKPAPTRLKLRSILVPTDFSPGAERALRYAAGLARQTEAKLTTMNVVEPLTTPDVEYFPLMIEPAKLIETAHAQLLSCVRDSGLARSLVNTPIVRTGTAFHEITSVAKECDVDLIVLATHGYTGINRLFLGSTAERVVRYAHCPVLVVGPDEKGEKSAPSIADSDTHIWRILTPVDFSDPSNEAIEYASAFATEFGSSLDLLYVTESAQKLKQAYGLSERFDSATAERQLRERLAELANAHVEEVVPVYPTVRLGKPVDQILHFARERKTDLIIMATHGRTGLKHVVMGSVAERVVRQAPCPVLVVRR